jgi:hypothetical protein
MERETEDRQRGTHMTEIVQASLFVWLMRMRKVPSRPSFLTQGDRQQTDRQTDSSQTHMTEIV